MEDLAIAIASVAILGVCHHDDDDHHHNHDYDHLNGHLAVLKDKLSSGLTRKSASFCA